MGKISRRYHDNCIFSLEPNNGPHCEGHVCDDADACPNWTPEHAPKSHHGRIDRDTAAGRIYRILRRNAGQYVSTYVLLIEGRTTGLSRTIDQIRKQGVEVECAQSTKKHPLAGRLCVGKDNRAGYYYRVAKVAK